MKTSNKILLGLLVVIFTVPFLLAVSLKSKVKKGEYTVVKREDSRNRGNLHKGSFTAFKVVKVVASNPDLLTCRFKQSDDMNYSYYTDDLKDSAEIFTSNDTLYIKYIMKEITNDPNERHEYNHLTVNVSLPAFNNLVVDGAVVIIDSSAASSGRLNITLKNRGVIKDGSKKRESETTKITKPESLKSKDLPVAEASNAKNNYTSSISMVEEARLEILDIDIKNLLIYRLLFMI